MNPPTRTPLHPPGPARVLIADDHSVVRHGLLLLLDREPDLTVVAEATDGAQAVELAVAGDVDLAILDIAMPRLTGLQAAAEISRRRPNLPILMLSMYDNDEFLFAALHAGASGYVLKSGTDLDLVTACRTALAGDCFLYPSATTALVRDYLTHTGQRPTDVLTPRELEVVKLVAEGRNSRQIAAMLTLSVKTVDRHRANILAKLDLRDRVQLTRYAIRRGLVEP